MPSVSGKQHRFMAAVASNPKFAKKAGVPQSVGEEFLKADKGRKFAGGGDMESKKMIGKEIAFMKKKGAPASMIKHEKAEMGMKKMAGGGPIPMGSGFVPAKFDANIAAVNQAADAARYAGAPQKMRGSMMASGGLAAGHKQADGIAKKGKTRGMEVKMAAGGLAAGHKQADGCAVRGKTKGKQVKMAMGGSC